MANFFDNKARAANAAAASSSKSKQATAVAETAQQPWVERYRPKDLSEVKSQDHCVDVLRRMISAANTPHLLFYGPPGNGKTSTILALCRELYGPSLFKSRVLSLNASDERGISIIRTKVKDFSRLQLSDSAVSEEYRKRYPCPPFKMVILDEADAMSQDAQSALRRVMEIYTRTTRFCIIANFISRIIDPVASRCSKFRFKTLAGEDAGARLREIAAAEHVRYEDGVIATLLAVSDGDLRRAVTTFQSSANLCTATAIASTKGSKRKKIVDDDSDEEMTDVETSAVVTVRTIEETAGVIPIDVIEKLIAAMQPPKAGSGGVYAAISKQVTDMMASGWSANQTVSQLYTAILADETLDLRKKTRMLSIFSEVDKRLVDGAEEELAILDMTLRLAEVMGGKQ